MRAPTPFPGADGISAPDPWFVMAQADGTSTSMEYSQDVGRFAGGGSVESEGQSLDGQCPRTVGPPWGFEPALGNLFGTNIALLFPHPRLTT